MNRTRESKNRLLLSCIQHRTYERRDEPLDKLSWVPEKLPAHIIYNEGDEGRTLDERWREHWAPRPVWDSLHTNSPAVITELTDVPYLPDQVRLQCSRRRYMLLI